MASSAPSPSVKRARAAQALEAVEGTLSTGVAASLAHARRLSSAAAVRHQHRSAAWYAEKAVALSGGAPGDVLLLADAHYRSGAFARAHRTLEHRGMLDVERFPSRAPCDAPPASAVAAEALPFFYLGALSLAGDGQWEPALALLEAAMEGPGQPGLRTPLCAPCRDTHAGVAACLEDIVSRERSSEARGAREDPMSAAGGGLGRSHGVSGAASSVPADGTSGGPAPFAGGGGKGGSVFVAGLDGLEDTSRDGLTVWRIVHAMGLQHCGLAAALSALGGEGASQDGVVLSQPRGEPIVLRGVPLEAPGGGGVFDSIPLGDGSSLNLVSCMASLRGEALIHCDNRVRATQWFLAALRLDPYNAAAMQALSDHCLLADKEEALLLEYLDAVLLPSPSAAKAAAEAGPPLDKIVTLCTGRASDAEALWAGAKAGGGAGPLSSEGVGGTIVSVSLAVGTGTLAELGSSAWFSRNRGGSDSAAAQELALAAGGRGGDGSGIDVNADGAAVVVNTSCGHGPQTRVSGDTGCIPLFNAVQWRVVARSFRCGWLRELYAMRLNRRLLARSPAARCAQLEVTLGLGSSVDVLSARGEALLAQHDPSGALACTQRVHAVDPQHRGAALTHYGALTALRRSGDLFQAAHAAVDAAPRAALSWYAVGCYYSSLGRFGAGARHFARAARLEPGFGHAWMGLGVCFSAQDEGEPAMAAFRTASRLFPASHEPLLALAVCATRAGQFALARAYLDGATGACAHDPLVFHEAGVLEYRQGAYASAWGLFSFAANALRSLPPHLRRAYEATYVNLGHASRKLGRHGDALAAYGEALSLAPGKPSTLAALGLTHQLAGAHAAAAAAYHGALAVVPEDAFSNRMLRVALQDIVDSSGGGGRVRAARTTAATAAASVFASLRGDIDVPEADSGGGGILGSLREDSPAGSRRSGAIAERGTYARGLAASSHDIDIDRDARSFATSEGSSGVEARGLHDSRRSSLVDHQDVPSRLGGSSALSSEDDEAEDESDSDHGDDDNSLELDGGAAAAESAAAADAPAYASRNSGDDDAMQDDDAMPVSFRQGRGREGGGSHILPGLDDNSDVGGDAMALDGRGPDDGGPRAFGGDEGDSGSAGDRGWAEGDVSEDQRAANESAIAFSVLHSPAMLLSSSGAGEAAAGGGVVASPGVDDSGMLLDVSERNGDADAVAAAGGGGAAGLYDQDVSRDEAIAQRLQEQELAFANE